MKDLTQGKPISVIWNFTRPIIGGNLFQLFYTLADTIIVGQTIGENALAAVGSTTVFFYFILCFIQGFTSGFGVIMAQRFGHKDDSGVKKSVVSSVYLSIFFTVLITLLFLPLTTTIIKLMDIPEEIQSLSYSYLSVILIGTGASIFYNMVSNTLRAIGDSKIPLVFLVFSSLLNIILDYVFIVPFGWGVGGAAWATVLSQLIAAILSLIIGLKKYPILNIEKNLWKLDKKNILDHLKLGSLMGSEMSVMCIGQIVMQSAVNGLGTKAIAGFTAASKVDQLAVLVDTAFQTSLSTYVAQNFGCGSYKRIKQGVWSALLIVEILNIIMALLMLFSSPYLAPLFVSNVTSDVNSYVIQYFSIIAPCYLLLGLIVVYRTADQSMNISWAPLVACILELIGRCLGSILLAKSLGYIGIVISHPLAWVLSDIIVVPVYFIYINKLNKNELRKILNNIFLIHLFYLHFS